MARTASYLGSPKAVANLVAQTITWTSSELESTGVIGYYVAFQPVGNTIAVVDRVRVRAAGQVIVELTLAQLLAYQAAFSKSNQSNATTGNILYIPLNLLDAPVNDARDKCQFPPGAEAQVEVVLLATAVTGTMVIGWQISNQKPEWFPRIVSSQGNIPASSLNAKFLFSESGIVRAISMPILGVQRAELQVSGQRAWNLPGPNFQALAYGDILSEKDTPEYASPGALTQRFHAIDLMLPAANGSSNLILDTGAAWVGVLNEFALYSVSRIDQFGG